MDAVQVERRTDCSLQIIQSDPASLYLTVSDNGESKTRSKQKKKQKRSQDLPNMAFIPIAHKRRRLGSSGDRELEFNKANIEKALIDVRHRLERGRFLRLVIPANGFGVDLATQTFLDRKISDMSSQKQQQSELVSCSSPLLPLSLLSPLRQTRALDVDTVPDDIFHFFDQHEVVSIARVDRLFYILQVGSVKTHSLQSRDDAIQEYVNRTKTRFSFIQKHRFGIKKNFGNGISATVLSAMIPQEWKEETDKNSYWRHGLSSSSVETDRGAQTLLTLLEHDQIRVEMDVKGAQWKEVLEDLLACRISATGAVQAKAGGSSSSDLLFVLDRMSQTL